MSSAFRGFVCFRGHPAPITAAEINGLRAKYPDGAGELAEFPENLEASFNVPKRRPSLVPDAVRVLAFLGLDPDPANAPIETMKLAGALRNLATQTATSGSGPALVPAPRAGQPAAASHVSATADPGELTATG
jgi:hypothetical protein